MTAYLFKPGKPMKVVKNLGWLLKNWKQVESFNTEVVWELPNKDTGRRTLQANLKDGGTYRVTFESCIVLSHWLRRPVFFGVMVNEDKLSKDEIPYSIFAKSKLGANLK